MTSILAASTAPVHLSALNVVGSPSSSWSLWTWLRQMNNHKHNEKLLFFVWNELRPTVILLITTEWFIVHVSNCFKGLQMPLKVQNQYILIVLGICYWYLLRFVMVCDADCFTETSRNNHGKLTENSSQCRSKASSQSRSKIYSFRWYFFSKFVDDFLNFKKDGY